jgi:ElaB/YqjD/DUF883 family membrane-anchored ribosome-binding protein
VADAIVYADTKGVIRFWNAGAIRIFGSRPMRCVSMSDRIEATATRSMDAKAINDAKRHAPDLYNQAVGQAQQQTARLSDVIKDQPLTTALLAVGIGYLLGRLTA